MSLSTLPDAAEGELTLSAELHACFSEAAHSVTLRWSAASASLEAAGRVRPLEPAEAKALVRQIVEAAEREEGFSGWKSTTHHAAVVTWRTGAEEQGRSSFHSSQNMIGEEMARFVREALAKPDLPEHFRRQGEASLARGCYARAIALFDLAERLAQRE